MLTFSRLWWELVKALSGRDQMAFAFMVHKFGIKVSSFTGSLMKKELMQLQPRERGKPGHKEEWREA